MSLPTLGLDIAKDKFDAALLHNDQLKQRAFANDLTGFRQLTSWLTKAQVTQVHACMEATGTYGEALAQFLYDAQQIVSVVNPVMVKGFARSELLRTKTDKTDAALLARFCLKQQPRSWTPPAPEIRELQALLRRLESLNQMHQMEANRVSSGITSPTVRASVQATLEFFEQEIRKIKKQIHDHLECHPDLKRQRDLLRSIPGIGEQTAAMLLAEFRDILSFESAREMAAFAGLTPKHHQSGASVRGKSRLDKMGLARIRKALYMPAIVALRYNAVIQAFGERLRAAGKHSLVIIAAAMRKLIHLAYGVLKSGHPFDPQWAQSHPFGA
jgi:transposase